MSNFGLQEESKISHHHEPGSQVVSHPEYCPQPLAYFQGLVTPTVIEATKKEAGWKKSDMVHPHR